MLSRIAAALKIDEDMLMIEAGRLPPALRKPTLEWARRDLIGFKQTVTGSAASIFEVNYDETRAQVSGDLPQSYSDTNNTSEDDEK
jgi:hypothetical protein